MAIQLKERWTEAEVKALPTGEHDFFDRKSGAMLLDGDFRNDLAKAISAFSNSGGGYVVLGMKNDATFDGVEPMRGRTSTREWLEQLIPDLVADQLAVFRVHEVEPSAPSEIPLGRKVIVIEFGDSPHAPHQSRVNFVYYFRQAGHSKPAPHFYLDALRRRFTAPDLIPKIEAIEPQFVRMNDRGVLAQFGVRIRITNRGRVAATRWKVMLKVDAPNPIASSIYVGNSHSGFTLNKPMLQRDQTLFPGFDRVEMQSLAVQLDATQSIESIKTELANFVEGNPNLMVQVFSEFPSGPEAQFPLKDFFPLSLAETLHWKMPRKELEQGRLYTGSGFWCTRIGFEDDSGDLRYVSGAIANLSDDHYTTAHFIARFLDENGLAVFVHEFSVNRINAGASKRFRELVPWKDVMFHKGLEVMFVYGEGSKKDGSRIHMPVVGVIDED